MRKTFNIRRNTDGTITVRVGRHVEHISTDRGKAETYDSVKYALISKGVNLTNVSLIEILDELRP
jgi:hypothetical protein